MLSQAQVEAEIMRISALAEKATYEIAKRAQRAAEANRVYKREHAKAYLRAQGPVEERKAQADVECDELYGEKTGSEAVLLSAQEAGRNYRAQLDSLRSVNANLRPLVTS